MDNHLNHPSKETQVFLKTLDIIQWPSPSSDLRSVEHDFLVTKDKTECTKTYKQASNEAGFSKDLGEHLKETHKEGRKSRMCVLDFRQSLISNYSHWSIKNNLKDYSILSTHMWVSENEGPVKKI